MKAIHEWNWKLPLMHLNICKWLSTHWFCWRKKNHCVCCCCMHGFCILSELTIEKKQPRRRFRLHIKTMIIGVLGNYDWEAFKNTNCSLARVRGGLLGTVFFMLTWMEWSLLLIILITRPALGFKLDEGKLSASITDDLRLRLVPHPWLPGDWYQTPFCWTGGIFKK